MISKLKRSRRQIGITGHHCYECVTKSLMLVSEFHFPEIIIIITQIERKPFVRRTENTAHNNRNRTDVKLWNEKCTNMKIICSGCDNHSKRVKHGNISKWEEMNKQKRSKTHFLLKAPNEPKTYDS